MASIYKTQELNSGTNSALLLRQKRRRFSFFILFAGVLVFIAAAGTLYFALRPEVLRIAVGPAGSDDQKLIQALAQTFAREKSSVRLTVISTDSATESLALLGADKADLAVARGDLDMPPDAQSVAILRKNMVVLWSPSGVSGKGSKHVAASKVKSLADLVGRRLGVVGTTQANIKLLRVILSESGIAPEKVAVVQFAINQLSEMAHDRSLDAFMAVGPLNSKITAEAIAETARERGEPRFLPIDVSEAIAQKHPLYQSEEIPGSTFSSSPARPDDKVETVSINHLIVARSELSETAIGTFTRQLFAVRQELERELPGATNIATPDTDKDAALPAHRGAAAYIDGTERTFLEKYSDYIWGAVLLLSGLGSAAAWFRSYLRRDEKAQSVALRDRVLALSAKARDANSAEELRSMQCEVDNVIRETLNAFDDGAIEEGDLTAFNLALEQFHRSVADRYGALDHPLTDRPSSDSLPPGPLPLRSRQ
ncbi:MAG TPA: TAXI family TRAP transporter solute-binding subunit [Bradyrhizobium sp.]|nr:TAXI family TRAP transporter solute-binding subunit [Bradyrhizobium sp.]